MDRGGVTLTTYRSSSLLKSLTPPRTVHVLCVPRTTLVKRDPWNVPDVPTSKPAPPDQSTAIGVL